MSLQAPCSPQAAKPSSSSIWPNRARVGIPCTCKAALGASGGYLGIFLCHRGLGTGALHSASTFHKVCVLAFRAMLETGRKKLPCLTLTPSSLSEQMKDDRVQLPLGNAFQCLCRPRSNSSSRDKATALRTWAGCFRYPGNSQQHRFLPSAKTHPLRNTLKGGERLLGTFGHQTHAEG